MLLNDPGAFPRREVSHFSVVPVLCQPQLRANQEDFLVMAYNATVLSPIGESAIVK